MVAVGVGRYTYEWVEGWGKLPRGWAPLGQASFVTDSQDRVYCFNRSEHPLVVFDRNGNVLTSWGEGVLVDAHGMHIDEDENLYLPVKDAHVVLKYDRQGNKLMELGTWNQPSDTGIAHGPGQPGWLDRPVARAAGPFNKPTDARTASNGDLYISDGYGNSRVHVFSSDGTLKFSWGQPGKFAAGEFHVPHGIWVHKDGRVFVADRENDRIQIFGPGGHFITAWTGFRRPCSVFIDQDDTVYVPELRGFVSILTIDGNVITRFDGPYGIWPQGTSAHFLWVDRHGDMYINQFLYEGRHKDKAFVRTGSTLVKYRKVG